MGFLRGYLEKKDIPSAFSSSPHPFASSSLNVAWCAAMASSGASMLFSGIVSSWHSARYSLCLPALTLTPGPVPVYNPAPTPGLALAGRWMGAKACLLCFGWYWLPCSCWRHCYSWFPMFVGVPAGTVSLLMLVRLNAYAPLLSSAFSFCVLLQWRKNLPLIRQG